MQLFPVYLASPGFVPPATGTYYLVAKDGIYMRVERLHGSAFIKVKEVPFLDSASKDVSFNLPKISALVMAQAKTFFESVFQNHQSESYLTLLFSKKLQSYRLWCPKQTVSYASVNYDRTDTVPVEERNYIGSEGDGWQMVGTIHSHCDFSAFHSGTDEADEASFDGVHLTFGHVNRNEFSIASSIVFSNNRTQVSPLTVALGINEPTQEEVTEEYEHNVRGVTVKKSYQRTEYFFNLNLNSQELLELESFKSTVLPEWLDKVNKYVAPVKSSSWVPYNKRADWYEEAKGQGWLYGGSDGWRYGSTKDDNPWGIREWDGD